MNIAKILVETPRGTRLWSPVMGVAEFDTILCDEKHTFYIQVKDVYGYCYKFTESGRLSKNGECLLFPSKEMRDWSKFSWKKGDVLKGGVWTCIFKEWADDDYSRFNGLFFADNCIFKHEGIGCSSESFKKASDDEAKAHIERIEKHCGGKLNLETLEIEKQSEFKDGDILHSEDCICGYIYICKGLQREVSTAYCYKLTGGGYLHICDLDNFYDCTIPSASIISDKTRYATEEEKQQLFDTLAKAGKRWNAETKTLEDLPKKQVLKPFDRVLVRDHDKMEWYIDFFNREDTHGGKTYFDCLKETWMQCIPYEATSICWEQQTAQGDGQGGDKAMLFLT